MSYNGSGTFSLASGNPVVTGTTISSTWANTTLSDIATGLTTAICKDGQTTPTANLPMGTYKHTGAGSATASGQYLVYGQSNASLGTTSFTGAVQFTAAVNNSATQTMVGAAANVAAEVDVASAATTDIGGAASNQIRITGTTGITSFGTTYTGPRFIRFAAALTITHNAASLILPGGASITTAAGDTCIALPLPSSAGWVVQSYQRASGTALVDTTTAATQAEMEAASSNAVAATPGNLKWGPMIPKAWGYITNSGVATLVSSYGVTSINRTGVGAITVTLSTAFSSSNYAIIASSVGGGNTAGATISTSSVFAISSRNGANADADVNVYFVCFGDQ